MNDEVGNNPLTLVCQRRVEHVSIHLQQRHKTVVVGAQCYYTAQNRSAVVFLCDWVERKQYVLHVCIL